MKITCCYQCTERHMNCHSTCIKYNEQRKALDKMNSDLRKKKDDDYALRRKRRKFANKS